MGRSSASRVYPMPYRNDLAPARSKPSYSARLGRSCLVVAGSSGIVASSAAMGRVLPPNSVDSQPPAVKAAWLPGAPAACRPGRTSSPRISRQVQELVTEGLITLDEVEIVG